MKKLARLVKERGGCAGKGMRKKEVIWSERNEMQGKEKERKKERKK